MITMQTYILDIREDNRWRKETMKAANIDNLRKRLAKEYYSKHKIWMDAISISTVTKDGEKFQGSMCYYAGAILWYPATDPTRTKYRKVSWSTGKLLDSSRE